jgi:hypothetical protein
VGGFALLAGIKVFLAAAALPLMNNVDEPAHYDLVVRYAQGRLPGRGEERIGPQAGRDIALYRSPEYLMVPEDFGERGYPPPIWSLDPITSERVLEQVLQNTKTKDNHEIHSPPVYYAVAGAWHRLGALCGLQGGRLVYWVRFLNIPIAIALTLLAYAAVLRMAPEAPALAAGVAVLTACIDQDMFYSINSDALSPLLFTSALICLVEWEKSPTPAWGLSAAGGILCAMTFLTKFSNVAVLWLLVVMVGWKLWQRRNETSPALLAETLWTLICGGAPIALWLLRNELVLGDLTGTDAKTRHLGWTVKPLSDWPYHPIFTLSGALVFWSELMSRFWRGEIVWHKQPMTPILADILFFVYSTLALAAVAVGWVWRLGRTPASRSIVLGALLSSVAVSVLFLAMLSVAFDFGNCVYPSREQPYLASGRLILGILVPFLIVSLVWTQWLPERFRSGALAGTCGLLGLACLSCWITRLSLALPSQYNWFHLR